MTLANISEHQDLQRTRKSLFLSSLFTFIVANANIKGSSLTIFGLQIAVDQSRLIAVGKLATAMLLAVFAIHAAEAIFATIRDTYKTAFSSWDIGARAEIAEIESEISNQGGAPALEIDDFEPWDRDYYLAKKKREKHLYRLDMLSSTYSSYKRFIVEYLIVLIFSATAIIHPQFLTLALKAIE